MNWEPERYSKFKSERSQPFFDLLKLVTIRSGLNIVDLGCGTGQLTLELKKTLPDSQVLGIDSSPEMLEKASAISREGLRFELRSIEDIFGSWDLIFSNAALHWIDDHRSLIPRLFSMLQPGGQLVAQFPSRHRNKAHMAIADVAAEPPFQEAMDGWSWKFPVLDIEDYAEILYEQGGEEIVVLDRVYPHILKDADAVLDWVLSTTCNPYIERLQKDLHEPFKNRVSERLWSLWPSGPVFFPFRRVLLKAQKPAT